MFKGSIFQCELTMRDALLVLANTQVRATRMFEDVTALLLKVPVFWDVTPYEHDVKRGVNHPPPCSAEVKVRVQLYLYSNRCAFVVGYRAKFTFNAVPTGKYQSVRRTVPEFLNLYLFHVGQFINILQI